MTQKQCCVTIDATVKQSYYRYFIKPSRSPPISGLTHHRMHSLAVLFRTRGPRYTFQAPILVNFPPQCPPHYTRAVSMLLEWLLKSSLSGNDTLQFFLFLTFGWFTHACFNTPETWEDLFMEGNEKGCICILCFREKKIWLKQFSGLLHLDLHTGSLCKIERFVEEIS